METSEHGALRQLVISCWDELRRPAVGARVLTIVQKRVAKQLTHGAGLSPAAIARILADEGAEMHHPEIIETDAAWRQKRLSGTKEFAAIHEALEQVTGLAAAEDLLRNLETTRRKFESDENKDGLARLRSLAIQARQTASLMVEGAKTEQLQRTHLEIVEWLKVWLQTPNLFNDWLELRKRSQEFRASFPDYPA